MNDWHILCNFENDINSSDEVIEEINERDDHDQGSLSVELLIGF